MRPEKSAIFSVNFLKEKVANSALRINSLAIAHGFANEIATISFSLQKFLANARQTAKSSLRSHKIDDQGRECKSGGGAYFVAICAKAF